MSESAETEDGDQREADLGAQDKRLWHAADRVALERAIDELPDGYRLVFMLHDVHGYEHHEIAEILGCTTGNTKSQLHKARLRLREMLKQSNSDKAAA